MRATSTAGAGWLPGQRVINEAEPALGIGQVARVVDHRNVAIEFLAAGATRIYNMRTAPIRRLVLHVGQKALGRDGSEFIIRKVLEQDGYLIYEGDAVALHERDLADQVPSEEVIDRLLNGPLSAPVTYELRRDGWNVRRRMLAHTTRGLVGARVRLLPHQLYIAWRISRQEVPRVLLADEVGLGKTIEAGLIFCALRALGRADRVLVLTPPSLVHQWLAELVRRFNEMFSVLDEARCEAMDEGGTLSPFGLVSRAICSLDLLAHNRTRLLQAIQAGWDLIIVDEAHHLNWSPQQESPQYAAVRELSYASRGLLLLSATPSRYGDDTEFGLLRLVDPHRFHDFDTYRKERENLQQVARLAARLKQGDTAVLDTMLSYFPDDQALRTTIGAFNGDPRPVLQALVDRHGTGRVLMRNRRVNMEGFPERVLHPVPLPPDGHPWEDVLGATPEGRIQLSDPRIEWLLDFLRDDPERKVVLIAHHPSTVVALQDTLRKASGVATALFHEGLTILERDRQAAWFGENDGAQILLCSEIGGEGRNFQFSQHLVLFDMPNHPDLLEQRIGRLDRIGQEHSVHIWALYFTDRPSEAMFRWYHEGLNAFHRPLPGAEHVFARLEKELSRALSAFIPEDAEFERRAEVLHRVLETTRQVAVEVAEQESQHVDFLVDLNSFDAEIGEQLVQSIQSIDNDSTLENYISRVLDHFGVLEEDLDGRGRKAIRPGELMFVETFPGLPRDRDMGATYRRSLALQREDLDFLSLDHILVDGAMSLMLDQQEGRASAAVWANAPEKGLLFEFLFVFEAVGPAWLELYRFLPVMPIEVVLDQNGQERPDLVVPDNGLHKLSSQALGRVSPLLRKVLPTLLRQAHETATSLATPWRKQALQEARRVLKSEHDRLQELRRLNPTVPEVELTHHRARIEAVADALATATARLDAARVVVLHPGDY